MTFKPLKQTDLRWKYLLLKPSNLTIGGYGCLLTDCSMAAGTTPDIAVDKVNFTESGMLIWESLIKIGLKLIKRERNKWDNQAVLDAIDKYGFCLAELVHPSGYIHWVFMIGNKQMIDPLSGKVEPTSKYSHYIGSCILQNIKQEETMPDALTECLAQHTKLVDELTKVKENLSKVKKDLKTKTAELGTCEASKAQMISRADFNLLATEKEALEKKLSELDKTPILEGKRKLVAGISAAVIILVSIILEKALGLEISPQELIAMLAGPLAYIGAEGTADLIRIFKPSESQTIKK